MEDQRLKKHLHHVLQIAFLALFIFLINNGKMQLWMGVFTLAILAAFVFGRLYCGWICPINTTMTGVTWTKKKLHIKSVAIPAFLTRPWVRITVLVLFLAVFAFTMVSGKRLPVLPALFAIGAFLTLFFPEELWHRHLCPYGTILSLPARKSKYAMRINPDSCNSCGICNRVCSAKAVEKSKYNYGIIKKDCLTCMECSEACPQNAISYRSLTNNRKESSADNPL
jgi:ferredoxin-type protein NapH